MTPEAQRIAIAEACGWTHLEVYAPTYTFEQFADSERQGVPFVRGLSQQRQLMQPPDYLSDLNAMHEAEKVLPGGSCGAYACNLGIVIGQSIQPSGWYDAFHLMRATAAQRAEALLRTLSKWTD